MRSLSLVTVDDDQQPIEQYAVDLLDEARDHLRLDTSEDQRLTRLIATAVQDVETVTDRQLLTATWDLTLDRFMSWIDLPKPPLQSVTWVKYRDQSGTWQTVDASTYVVRAPGGPTAPRARLTLADGASWPTAKAEAGSVMVRFVAGYGETTERIPMPIQTAILLIVEDLFDEQPIDTSVAGRSMVRQTAKRLLLPYLTRSLQAA